MSSLLLDSLSTVFMSSELAFSVVAGAKVYEATNLSLLFLLPSLILSDKRLGPGDLLDPDPHWNNVMQYV
jgi:hypothetical protein